jgi:hypothetical protein
LARKEPKSQEAIKDERVVDAVRSALGVVVKLLSADGGEAGETTNNNNNGATAGGGDGR